MEQRVDPLPPCRPSPAAFFPKKEAQNHEQSPGPDGLGCDGGKGGF